MEEDSSGRHLGGKWEASGRSLGGLWELSERHLGGWGGHGGLRGISEQKMLKIIVFYSIKWRDRVFRVHGSDVTCTKYCK